MTADVAQTVAGQEGLSPAALPGAVDVRGLLNGLFEKPATVHEELRPVLPGRGVQVVGTYVEGGGSLRALVLLDLTLGCVLGAALAMVRMPRVEEALSGGSVPQDLADNTQEVLNVAASLFNSADAHLKLRAVQVVPEPVTADVVDFLRAHPHRVDYTVEVPGYGTGVLVLLLAQPD